MFGCGVAIYSEFMKIRHNNIVVVMKSYGQCDFFFDSINIDLMVQLPSFDTNTAPPTEISYHSNPFYPVSIIRDNQTQTFLFLSVMVSING